MAKKNHIRILSGCHGQEIFNGQSDAGCQKVHTLYIIFFTEQIPQIATGDQLRHAFCVKNTNLNLRGFKAQQVNHGTAIAAIHLVKDGIGKEEFPVNVGHPDHFCLCQTLLNRRHDIRNVIL